MLLTVCLASTTLIVGLAIAGVAILFILWLFGLYNACVRLRNRVKNAWAQIDVQ